MRREEMQLLLEFIQVTEQMKIHTRHSWNSQGKQESIAEHSWRLSLMAVFMSDMMDDIDVKKLLQLCIVHDLGEVFEGDISAKHLTASDQKDLKEKEAISQLMMYLNDDKALLLKALTKEYDEGITKEARLAKALDKLETIVQHNQGKNPENFDYAFNLKYGKKYIEQIESLSDFSQLVDEQTKLHMKN